MKNLINSSRGLIVSKIAASVASFLWLAIMAKYVSSANLGAVFECLFISQSMIFLTDQGLTATLLRRQSFGVDLNTDVSQINACLKIRARRTVLLIPVLVVLLLLLTDVSFLAIFAVVISHIATLAYSTINTGLLGANLRYVESLSEPGSRLFILILGSLCLLSFDQFASAQSIIMAYTAADLFMLVLVVYLYRRIYSRIMGVTQSAFRVDPQYRRQSTVTAGTLSTVGLGETWALSFRSTSSDFAFYGLVSRVIDISGLVASYAGYSHLPQLVSEMGDQNWEILLRRIRRVMVFSLIPTGLLAALVLTIGVTDVSIPGYDIAGHWLPLLALVLSTPAVVLSKYLLQSIANLDPKALVFVSIFTGTTAIFGVILMYELYGLSGTFLVIATTNVARACWLSFLARRFRSSDHYL